MKPKNPRPKHKHPNRRALECLATGRYLFVGHALRQLQARRITLPEVEEAIALGRHRSEDDRFDEKHDEWRYLIEGRTKSTQRDIRVVVCFEPDDGMLIITAFEPYEDA